VQVSDLCGSDGVGAGSGTVRAIEKSSRGIYAAEL
jgi:hypothetical protein